MPYSDTDVQAFIDRWGPSGGGERSNYQMFLTELCDLIGAPKPNPAQPIENQNAYVFERTVPAKRIDGPTTTNFIDLYKRHCFVLEAKQSRKRQSQLAELKQLDLGLPKQRTGSGQRGGAQWDTLMRQAREQAERYAKRLPPEEGWPPFLITCDVGHVLELFADFSLQGKHYAQFPDRQSFRIYLEDLRDKNVRERLRLIWTDPESLNPARRTAEVTREVAELLAKLSKSMETRLIRQLPKDLQSDKQTLEHRNIAEKVALFLMRCLFTMFAEDVGLLTRDSFSELLKSYKGQADKAHHALTHLWQKMNTGGFSTELRTDLLKFNGGLFKDATALTIDEDALNLLIIAADRDWKDVEPAIFGTLLERALDPGERHKLGAHYTPRAYVERLVVATIIEPLTEDWRNVQAAAAQLIEEGKAEDARDLVRDFHQSLCAIRVLDPACGTGNFLYVAMELMKRVEGEILETLTDLGEDQYLLELDRHTVDPHQFLGMEINPRAVAIAELVLWIGYLQWHFRTRGQVIPAQPVLKNFKNIQEQDAILAYDSWDVLRDAEGKPISRWDGITHKLHPITGEEIPDENARIELRKYVNPRPATWPEADFIVGNPPFLGKGAEMREGLGDGYVEALYEAWPLVPKSADYVMFWWNKSADLLDKKKIRRFGLITTKAIGQTFNSRVIDSYLKKKNPIAFYMAIPNHPWLRSVDTAAVRIAMTVVCAGPHRGQLGQVVSEANLNSDSPDVDILFKEGTISADLSVGPDLQSASPLLANNDVSRNGMMLAGQGFKLEASAADAMIRRDQKNSDLIKPYLGGREILYHPRNRFVIDAFEQQQHELQNYYPILFQHLYDNVYPERSLNRRAAFRERWWIFGEPRRTFRPALRHISRFILTTETAKHRIFQFFPTTIIPDHMLVCIALDDAFHLGILSSHIHVAWALAAGGRLGVGNDPRYNKSRCFDPFPFPHSSDALKAKIRDLGEALDRHRKDVITKHKQLTMTGLYNVLEKVRAGDELSDADKDVYDAGLIGVLKKIHDDLDTAVAEAYGWPTTINDEEILERLVALNRERAKEEAAGHVRWLRPEYQAPKEPAKAKKAQQIEADLILPVDGKKKPTLAKSLPEQVAQVKVVLSVSEAAISAADLSQQFSQGRRVEKKVEELLRTLVLLGQAERINDGYVLSQ